MMSRNTMTRKQKSRSPTRDAMIICVNVGDIPASLLAGSVVYNNSSILEVDTNYEQFHRAPIIY